MFHHIENKIYHIEILPPKQDTEKLETDLDLFSNKYMKALELGSCICLTDNAMGNLAFQGSEVIEELKLPVKPEQIMIHLNTFHTLEDLKKILDTCKGMGIRYLLVISGDGSDRLPKLQSADLNLTNAVTVTSVELLSYIQQAYPNDFVLGVAFNPYEPPEHEFHKLDRKIKAGASFIVTQPVIEKNEIVDQLLTSYPGIPTVIEAWMSRKLHLLSEAVGYEIPENTEFDPVETLKMLHKTYPDCGVYLSLLGFKTQFDLIKETWI
jgi:methylenetetrahydrofolate reductase (NADPH)